MTSDERARAAADARIVGGAQDVVSRIKELTVGVHVDEILVNTIVADPHRRARSYELLAESWS
ncbi:hypothetical protein [Mycolicibacterium smegmatis]|uniref:hypothetical protein n=1 Tax=Mycolicibacterium smegmatis TaxID=1772 RepID=UPI00130028F4|nr:hypothetical protein [Mycolicibacterium smegmatis]